MIKPYLVSFLLLVVPAAAQQSDFAGGRAAYQAGEFKVAVKHFKQALRTNPLDAESTFWLGRSYETLADISAPFGARYHSQARAYLTKATELAPHRLDYRHELFDFLLDSGEQRQSLGLLLTSLETDPDYDRLRSRYVEARQRNTSAYGRLNRFGQMLTGTW